MKPPFTLSRVDPTIASSYGERGATGGPRAACTPLHKLGTGVLVDGARQALSNLAGLVAQEAGDFRVTSAHRDVFSQTALRARYEAWVAAGKPAPGSASFDPARMKAAFVSRPGRSNHNGGRAIDVDLASLRFPNVAPNRQLDTFWRLAKLAGWEPIIAEPDERATEAWHFDWWGDLAGVHARLGYEQAAWCGALLVGHGGTGTSFATVTQALLQRAGHDIGKIDGALGPRSRAALATALSMAPATVDGAINGQDASIWRALALLPGA
jgi:hypothetical protein